MLNKSLLIGLSLILFVIIGIKSYKIDEYIQNIEELMKDKVFMEEYKQWSFKLFSDPTYLYGPKVPDFPCTVQTKRDPNEIITVHNLRPSDIQCVGAIGDSLTAALGAHATTPIGLMTEYRGVSWAVGGDYSYDTVLTLPNILKQYNPKVKGFSTKTSLFMGKGQNSSHNALNVAESGDVAQQMPDQSHILEERILKGKYCDFQNDWKVITLLIGGNDLCQFCKESETFTPANFSYNVQRTLDYFHENFPRTFVNLVLVLDVRNVKKLNAGGTVCSLFHRNTCPCAAYPSETDAKLLNEYFYQYHTNLVNLVNSGRYDTRDDFTVVVQPFMANTTLPLIDGEIDYSYFAPDCFHFSGKGHSRSALSLWNNMLEPVGEKQWEWHEGETIECPTEERPFFATRKNSPQSFEKLPRFY